MKTKPIGIGILARQTGCCPETIRYYEKQGLLPRPQRSAGGHRLYDAAQIQRLRFILRARELGFRQQDVRSLLRFADNPDASCADVQHLAEVHLEEVREKRRDLERMESVLEELVNSCARAGRPGDCPIVGALRATEEAYCAGIDPR